MRKIDLIILAAGESSRFGSLKGFAHYAGKPLLESAIELHQKNFHGKTIIVYSRHSFEYKKNLSNRYRQAHFIENSNPHNGPFSSLQIGLTQSEADHYFILPVDCPCRTLSTWDSLYTNITPNKCVIKPSFKKRGGHPIIFNQVVKEQALKMPSTNRTDEFIRSLPLEKIKYIDVNDPTVLKNINSRDDLN